MTKSGIEQNNQELVLTEIALFSLLKKERKKQKIRLEDVAILLKIKKQDLQAIENSQLDVVPRHLYLIGIIRSYSRMLKIDQDIIEKHIKLLSIESNINNKKHKLINIGETLDLKPNREQFVNFLAISLLLFFTLLFLCNLYEDGSGLLRTNDLTKELNFIETLNELN